MNYIRPSNFPASASECYITRFNLKMFRKFCFQGDNTRFNLRMLYENSRNYVFKAISISDQGQIWKILECNNNEQWQYSQEISIQTTESIFPVPLGHQGSSMRFHVVYNWKHLCQQYSFYFYCSLSIKDINDRLKKNVFFSVCRDQCPSIGIRYVIKVNDKRPGQNSLKTKTNNYSCSCDIFAFLFSPQQLTTQVGPSRTRHFYGDGSKTI